MLEKRQEKLASMPIFLKRMAVSISFGIMIILIALSVGMLGYHSFETMSWVDAFLNASMILSGMGPVSTLVTTGGKLFAGTYALFSGLAFIAIIAVIIAPIFHRFIHKFHMEVKD